MHSSHAAALVTLLIVCACVPPVAAWSWFGALSSMWTSAFDDEVTPVAAAAAAMRAPSSRALPAHYAHSAASGAGSAFAPYTAARELLPFTSLSDRWQAAGGVYSTANLDAAAAAGTRALQSGTSTPSGLLMVLRTGRSCLALTSATLPLCWSTDAAALTRIPSWPDYTVLSLAAGPAHVCAILTPTTGSDASSRRMTVCWGDNSAGQATVPDEARYGATALAAGALHTCAWLGGLTPPRMKCWGYNGLGQASPPASVTDVTSLSAGYFHTCAYGSMGVACWGASSNGQLVVPTLPAGRNVRLVSGTSHSCALDVDTKSVNCWGAHAAAHTSLNASFTSNIDAVAANVAFTCAGSRSHQRVTCILADLATPAGGVSFVSAEANVDSLAVSQDGVCVRTTSNDLVCTPMEAGAYPAHTRSGVTQVVAGEQFVCTRNTTGGAACFLLNPHALDVTADVAPMLARIGASTPDGHAVCEVSGSAPAALMALDVNGGAVPTASPAPIACATVSPASNAANVANLSVPATMGAFTFATTFGACNGSSVSVQLLAWNATTLVTDASTTSCSSVPVARNALPQHASHSGRSACEYAAFTAVRTSHLSAAPNCSSVNAAYADARPFVSGSEVRAPSGFACSTAIVSRNLSAAVLSGAYQTAETPFRTLCAPLCMDARYSFAVGPPLLMCDTSSTWAPATHTGSGLPSFSAPAAAQPAGASLTVCNASTAAATPGGACAALDCSARVTSARINAPATVLPYCLHPVPTAPAVTSVTGCDTTLEVSWRVSNPSASVAEYMAANPWPTLSTQISAAASDRLQRLFRLPGERYRMFLVARGAHTLPWASVLSSSTWKNCTDPGLPPAALAACQTSTATSRIVLQVDDVTESAAMRAQSIQRRSLDLNFLNTHVKPLHVSGAGAAELVVVVTAAVGSDHSPAGIASTPVQIVSAVSKFFESGSSASLQTVELPSTCARVDMGIRHLVTLSPSAARLIVSDALPPGELLFTLSTLPAIMAGESVTLSCDFADATLVPHLTISPRSVVIGGGSGATRALQHTFRVAFANISAELSVARPSLPFTHTSVECRVTSSAQISYADESFSAPLTLVRSEWLGFTDAIVELDASTWRSTFSSTRVNVSALLPPGLLAGSAELTEAHKLSMLGGVLATRAPGRPLTAMSLTLTGPTNVTLVAAEGVTFDANMLIQFGASAGASTLPSWVSADGRFARFLTPARDAVCPAADASVECSMTLSLLHSTHTGAYLSEADLTALADDDVALVPAIHALAHPVRVGMKCPPMCPRSPTRFAVQHTRAPVAGQQEVFRIPSLGTTFAVVTTTSTAADSSAAAGGASVQTTPPVYYIERCYDSAAGFTDPSTGACTNMSDPLFELCAFGQGASCTRCMDGAMCPGGTRAWPLPGFWTTAESSGTIIPCAPPASVRCPGWNDTAGAMVCGEGYSSSAPACGGCLPGWYRDRYDGTCKACPSNDMASVMLLPLLKLVGGIVGASLLFVGVLYFRARAMGKNLAWIVKRTMQFGLLCFTSIQATVTIGRAALPGMPPALQQVYKALNVFQFEGLTLEPACLSGSAGPYVGQIVELSIGIGAVGLVLLAGGAAAAIYARKQTAPRALRTLARLGLMVLSALFAILANCVFSLLNCTSARVSVDAYLSMSSDGGVVPPLLARANVTMATLLTCRASPYADGCAMANSILASTTPTLYVWKSNPSFVCFESDHALPTALAFASIALILLLFPLGSFLYTYRHVTHAAGTQPWTRRATALLCCNCCAGSSARRGAAPPSSAAAPGQDAAAKARAVNDISPQAASGGKKEVDEIASLRVALETHPTLLSAPELQPFVTNVFQAARFYFIHINFVTLVLLGALVILWGENTTVTSVILQCLLVVGVKGGEWALQVKLWPYKDDEFHVGVTHMFMSFFAILAAITNAIAGASGLMPDNTSLLSGLQALAWVLVVVALLQVFLIVFAYYVVLTPNAHHGGLQFVARAFKCNRSLVALKVAAGEMVAPPEPTIVRSPLAGSAAAAAAGSVSAGSLSPKSPGAGGPPTIAQLPGSMAGLNDVMYNPMLANRSNTRRTLYTSAAGPAGDDMTRRAAHAPGAVRRAHSATPYDQENVASGAGGLTRGTIAPVQVRARVRSRPRVSRTSLTGDGKS